MQSSVVQVESKEEVKIKYNFTVFVLSLFRGGWSRCT